MQSFIIGRKVCVKEILKECDFEMRLRSDDFFYMCRL
jgi:hypothetical protein